MIKQHIIYFQKPISKMVKFIIFDQASIFPPYIRCKIVKVNIEE